MLPSHPKALLAALQTGKEALNKLPDVAVRFTEAHQRPDAGQGSRLAVERPEPTRSPRPRSQPEVSTKRTFPGESDSTRGLLSERNRARVLEVKDSDFNS